MIPEKLCEFSILLQLENLAKDNKNFAEYIQKFNLEKINSRYKELLDEFLNPYMQD